MSFSTYENLIFQLFLAMKRLLDLQCSIQENQITQFKNSRK